jgi:hypothetical protein
MGGEIIDAFSGECKDQPAGLRGRSCFALEIGYKICYIIIKS